MALSAKHNFAKRRMKNSQIFIDYVPKCTEELHNYFFYTIREQNLHYWFLASIY